MAAKFTAGLVLLALASALVAGQNSNKAYNYFDVQPYGNGAFIVSIANSVAQANYGNADSSATSNVKDNIVGRKLLQNSNEAYNSFIISPAENGAFIVSVANSVAQANYGNANSAATSNVKDNIVGRKLLQNSNEAYNGFIISPAGNGAFIVSVANSVAQANYGNANSAATSNVKDNIVGRKLLQNSNEAYNGFIISPAGNGAFIVSVANSVAQANYGNANSAATSNVKDNIVGRKLLQNSNYADNYFNVSPYGNGAFIVSVANSVAQANYGNANSAATSNVKDNIVGRKLLQNSNSAYNYFDVQPYGNGAFIVSIANSVAQANNGNAYSTAESNVKNNVVGK